MRWLLVFLFACSNAREPHPILTINPVIGDASFIAKFHRQPTADDDAHVRVATHLAYVSQLLHARPSSPARDRLLAALDHYIAIGQFPHSEATHDLLPSFVDRETGVRCAVAYLVDQTSPELVAAIDRDHHNDYIADIARDPRFIAWAATSGLSRDELALIQPSYEYDAREHGQTAYGAALSAAAGVDDSTTTPQGFGLVQLFLRYTQGHNKHDFGMFGDANVAIGAIAAHDRAFAADLAGDLAFDAHARFGTTFPLRVLNDYSEGLISIGAGADRFGHSELTSFTVPIDLDLHRTARDSSFTFGIHSGLRIAASGRETIGWTAGVALYHRDAHEPTNEITLSLDTTRLDGAQFVGATLGFVITTRHVEPDWNVASL